MSGQRYAPRCTTLNCTANRKGLCIALSESYPEGDCPFFRSKKSLSRMERYEYERVAENITPKERPENG